MLKYLICNYMNISPALQPSVMSLSHALSMRGDQEREMSRQKLSSHTISRGELRLETGCFDKPFVFF